MTFRELSETVRWYVLRDVGWVWFLVAATGLIVGAISRKTRPLSLMLVSGIITWILYMADWYDNAEIEMNRFIIMTIPLTILGIGFLWQTRKRIVRAALVLLVATYIVLVTMGLRAPKSSSLVEAPFLEKTVFFPYYQASSVAGYISDSLMPIADTNALANALPDDITVVLPGSDWSISPFFFDSAGKHKRKIIWVSDQNSNDWISDLTDEQKAKPILLDRALNNEQTLSALSAADFKQVGKVFGATLFERGIPVPGTRGTGETP
jgi:hypothetical protein